MPADHRPHGDEALLAHLHEEVARHDPAARPVQHATARFHLGTTLLATGRAREAAAQLRRAVELFPADGLPIEHAKARNMLGVAQRDLGDPSGAAASFAAAGQLFAQEDQRLEEAAARYNRGLVLRDLGDEADAADAFARALAVFTEADARVQAAAAGRELGASLLATGELDRARDALLQAQELARRGGDRAALGAAANVRGVVELAAERPDEATAAFLDACGAHPRAVRPAEHAMARANLALAHERAGRPAHALLAARQALAVPQLPPAAHAQATAVTTRSAELDEDPLVGVLRSEPVGGLPGVLRAEVARLGEDPGAHATHAGAVVAALHEQAGRGDRAAAWLEVVLEQPPTVFRGLLEAVVRAVEEVGDEQLRAELARAVAGAAVRFHPPQWMRVRDGLAAIAAREGATVPWS